MLKFPLSEIHIDLNRFQNRSSAYSAQSVERIVSAYDPRIMEVNPVALWEDESGKAWLLAGHSRYQAHVRLALVDICAQFFVGTEKEAIEYALNSNNQSARETYLERIALYRRKYAELGNLQALLDYMGRYEAKNSVSFLSELVHLNPNGVLLQSLASIQDTHDHTQRSQLERIASYVGACFILFADRLLPHHETEMVEYLNRHLNSLSKGKFIGKVRKVVSVESRSKSAPLNLGNVSSKSAIQKELDDEENALLAGIARFETQIKELHGKMVLPADNGTSADAYFVSVAMARNEAQNQADALRLALLRLRRKMQGNHQHQEAAVDLFSLPMENTQQKRVSTAKANTAGETYNLSGVPVEDKDQLVPILALNVGDRYKRKNLPSYKIWRVTAVNGANITVSSGDNNTHTVKGESDLMVYRVG